MAHQGSVLPAESGRPRLSTTRATWRNMVLATSRWPPLPITAAR